MVDQRQKIAAEKKALLNIDLNRENSNRKWETGAKKMRKKSKNV